MKKRYALLALILFLTQGSYSQWAQGKGNGYFKLGGWYLETDQHYTSSGEIDPNVTRTQSFVSLYSEYGLGERLDIVAYLPFFARATQNQILSGTTGEEIRAGEELNSLGDLEIGLNLNFLKSDHWALSTRLMLGIPTGENQGGSDGSFQTGDGEFNQLATILAGYSFNLPGRIFYAKTYFGINNRTENFSDELRFGLESGLGFFDNKLLLIGRINGVESLQNGSLNAQNSAQGNIFANNVEYLSAGGELNYFFSPLWGISVGVDGAFSGRIIAANPSFNGGVFYKLQ